MVVSRSKKVGGLVISLEQDNNSKGFVTVKNPEDNDIGPRGSYPLTPVPVSMEEADVLYRKTIKNQWTARAAYEKAREECGA